MEELRIEANGNLGPIDSSRIPRYAGAATYARLPRLDQVAKADVTVVGIPFDSGVSYRPGARFGANHVREASRLLRPYNPAWDVSPFENIQVADAGDMAVNPFNINEAIETVQQNALDLTAAGSKLLTLGGDHTIALPLLRAAAERAGDLYQKARDGVADATSSSSSGSTGSSGALGSSGSSTGRPDSGTGTAPCVSQ